jgi:hypothetical protein
VQQVQQVQLVLKEQLVLQVLKE